MAPLELLLVETDAPFLTPVPNRGKPNSPAMAAHTVRASLSDLKDLDVADLCAQLQRPASASSAGEHSRAPLHPAPLTPTPPTPTRQMRIRSAGECGKCAFDPVRGQGAMSAGHAVRLLGAGDVREIAGRLGVRPTKRLGQNFVVDPGTVRRIATLASPFAPGDVVLEVGPGSGR